MIAYYRQLLSRVQAHPGMYGLDGGFAEAVVFINGVNAGTGRHAPGRLRRVASNSRGWVQLEPEGGTRQIRHGDRLTVTFSGNGAREIEIYACEDGIVVWRPLDSFDVTIVDQDGAPINDLF